MTARLWIDPPRRRDAVDALDHAIANVKEALTAAGIDLPYPTSQVLLHDQTEETDGDRARQREGWPAGTSPPRPRWRVCSGRTRPPDLRRSGFEVAPAGVVEALGDQFWLRPAFLVLGCLGLAQLAVWIETARIAGNDASSPDANWGYSGGAEGARALLSAVASSTIGVAGTTFSITIAALTLASNQMGPRCCAKLRARCPQPGRARHLPRYVRLFADGPAHSPHSAGESLRSAPRDQWGHRARAGLARHLVWFVHHIATSINVETVVDAVHHDLCEAVEARTLKRRI